jgi:flagellar basal body-associated protein FliL
MPDAQAAAVKTPLMGRLKIAFVLLAGVSLALGAWIWGAQSSGVASDSGGRVKSSLHLETFVVNLADREQRSYLRVGIDLGLGRELPKAEAAPVAQVRDTILGVLGQCQAEELLTAPGKSKLKQDLLRALQERVPNLDVEEVYFNEFLIQR